MLTITTISASILGLLLAALSLNVIRYRGKHKVSLGDGDNEELLRAVRAQANLCEYAPIALILVACLELNQAPLWLTSILASIFVLGRLIHPMGMINNKFTWQPRVRGMQLTLLSIIIIATSNLVLVGLNMFT